MVNITYNPIKEITINEVITYNTIGEWEEELLSGLMGGHQVVLKWAEGVLFDYNTYPVSETILKDRLKGTLYIDSLFYTLMPEYTPSKTIEPPSGGMFTYTIVNVTKNENLVELAHWIKEHDKSKT